MFRHNSNIYINLFTFLSSVDVNPPTEEQSSGDHEVESDTNENVESDENVEELNFFVRKKASKVKKTSNKKAGRKAQWSQSLLGDLVDIIISSDYYKKKLIFTNTKNQKNGDIYQKILGELKERASNRGEEVPFNNIQLRTKFKKAVSECKRAALTVKTATGIKRFIEDKGYGPWFNNLYAIVKTREACRPELAIEPSFARVSLPDADNVDSSSSSSSGVKEKLVIPKSSKKKKEDPVFEAIGLIKNVIENDPMKDMVSYLREEAERSRQHEIKMLQMLMQPPPTQQPAAFLGPLASPYGMNNNSNQSWQYNNQVRYSSRDQYEGGPGYDYQNL